MSVEPVSGPILPMAPPATSALARVDAAATRGLARLHHRTRRWPVVGQIAWWVLLLPFAVLAWAATITTPWLRRTAWAATAVMTIGAGVSSASSGGASEPASVAPIVASSSTVTTTVTTVAATSTTAVPSTTAAATTTSTVASTTTVVGSTAATAVLDLLVVTTEHQDGYSRELFPTWLAVEQGGCDARILVLLRETTTPVPDGAATCTAAGGTWTSAYDEARITDPADVEIDHLVSLKEAWDSGAWAWTTEQRAAYANDVTDTRTLHASSQSANRSKADKDPSNWLPSAPESVCPYLSEWLSVKARWALTMDESEAGRVRNLLRTTCPGLVVAPWPSAPLALPSATTTTLATEAPVLTTATSILGIYTPPATTQPVDTDPPATQPAATDPPRADAVTPGAFCSPSGATGVTVKGTPMVCSSTNAAGVPYAGGRSRWRSA